MEIGINIMEIIKSKLVMLKEKNYNDVSLESAEEVYNFLKEVIKLNEEPEEVLFLMCINQKLNLVSCFEVSRGNLSSIVVKPSNILKRALLSNVEKIIIAHNHPSGESYPSLEDKIMTSELKKASNILGIYLLDHVIVGDNKYYSFYEQNPNLINEKETNKFYKNHNKMVKVNGRS